MWLSAKKECKFLLYFIITKIIAWLEILLDSAGLRDIYGGRKVGLKAKVEKNETGESKPQNEWAPRTEPLH